MNLIMSWIVTYVRHHMLATVNLGLGLGSNSRARGLWDKVWARALHATVNLGLGLEGYGIRFGLERFMLQ